MAWPLTPLATFLIANFGTDHIELMTRDGHSKTLYTEIDGQPLGKTNFILRDSHNRIWFSVTTRSVPWTRSINEKLADGYVAMIDERGIHIMADGFVGTNEIRFDAREQWLYVVETNARRISRLRVGAGAQLSDREIFGPRDLGGHTRWLCLRCLRQSVDHLVHYDGSTALTPQGELLVLLDDGDAEKCGSLSSTSSPAP